MKLQTRLTFMGACVGIATLAAVLLAVVFQTYHFRTAADNEVNELINSDLSRVTRSAFDLVRSQDQSIQQRVNAGQNVAQMLVQQKGGVTLGDDSVVWQASNQFTHEKTTVHMPQLLLGGEWLGKNENIAVEEPLVDNVTRLTNVTITVFQKMDSQGDLLRVATDVQTKAGKRAIGTYIPVINPDGKPNKVVSEIMAGHTYTGNAYVVNAWYVSTYTPIFDNKHRVIGALYAGMKQESVGALRESIQQVTVGRTGHVVVLTGSGAAAGTYLISPQNADDGKSIGDATDSNGQLYFQNITKMAKEATPGDSVAIRYPLKDSATGKTSWQIGRAIYYAPWDWLIIAETNSDDYASFGQGLQNLQTNMLFVLAIVGLIVGLLAHISFSFYSKHLAGRIIRMVEAAGRIAAGETDIPEAKMHSVSADSKDELEILEGAFQKVVKHLDEMAIAAERIADGDLRHDVIPRSKKDRLGMSFQQMTLQLRQLLISVADVSGRIGDASNTLSMSANASVDAGQKVSDAMREVAETSQQSAIGANEVARNNSDQSVEVAEASTKLKDLSASTTNIGHDAETTLNAAIEANTAAENGSSIVTRTIKGMETIRDTVSKAATVISTLGESSNEIGTIVETISRIADQTNLLALNAAIEAARAGESGLGFAVVADEVRKLAARSTAATGDIAKLISHVQKQTEEAIAAMSAGTAGVDTGVTLAGQAGDALVSIQERNKLVVGRVTQILASAKEISDATMDMARRVDNIASLMEVTSAAAEEVSAGSTEVASAVHVVSLTTESEQRNAEKVDNAARELASIVSGLDEIVQQYDVEPSTQPTNVRRAA
jgi:methyl-accepting chemotaxis protein